MPSHASSCPQALQSCPTCCKHAAHLRSEPREVLQVAADPVGLLDDGVDVQLGDLLHEAVVITLAVLKH